jgi:hypothetical protein
MTIFTGFVRIALLRERGRRVSARHKSHLKIVMPLLFPGI